VLFSVAAAALVLAGPAAAAYTSPRIAVANSSKQLRGAGVLTVTLSQAAGDQATARIVVYVPRRYRGPLAARAGRALGSGSITTEAEGVGRSTVAGTLRAVDPAPLRDDALRCSGQARLDAAFRFDTGGRGLDQLVYVRAIATGAEAAYASAALTVCYESPAGQRLQPPAPPLVLRFSVTLRGVFANPSAAGTYRWRSLWTPYEADGKRDDAGLVEAQALDVLPAQVSLVTGRYDRRARKLFVGGTLLENRRPSPGASVQLLAGRSARGIARLAVARTNANGNYGGRLTLPTGTWFLQSRATVRARTLGGCTVRTIPGVQCLRTTTAGYTLASRLVRVQVR
jgi:hypothetical protein